MIVEDISVALSPSTGPSGTEVVVIVSGAEPGEPITIILPAGAEAGVAAAGTYTTSDIFLGDPGDGVIVTVILGAGQAMATFTISA